MVVVAAVAREHAFQDIPAKMDMQSCIAIGSTQHGLDVHQGVDLHRNLGKGIDFLLEYFSARHGCQHITGTTSSVDAVCKSSADTVCTKHLLFQLGWLAACAYVQCES